VAKIIEVRKLAAVDMAWLGARIITAEYALGILLPLALGIFSLRAGLGASRPSLWQVGLGVWLLGIACNYVPLFLYAVSIGRAGTLKAEGEPEIAHAPRYGAQQVMILVPLLVVALALMQESSRRRHGP